MKDSKEEKKKRKTKDRDLRTKTTKSESRLCLDMLHTLIDSDDNDVLQARKRFDRESFATRIAPLSSVLGQFALTLKNTEFVPLCDDSHGMIERPYFLASGCDFYDDRAGGRASGFRYDVFDSVFVKNTYRNVVNHRVDAAWKLLGMRELQPIG